MYGQIKMLKCLTGWRVEKRYRQTARTEKFTGKLIGEGLGLGKKEREWCDVKEKDGVRVQMKEKKQVIHYWGPRLSTELQNAHKYTHWQSHTQGGWQDGVVGVRGHALSARVSDSLLPYKNHKEDEGQSFLHISSSTCLQATDAY